MLRDPIPSPKSGPVLMNPSSLYDTTELAGLLSISIAGTHNVVAANMTAGSLDGTDASGLLIDGTGPTIGAGARDLAYGGGAAYVATDASIGVFSFASWPSPTIARATNGPGFAGCVDAYKGWGYATSPAGDGVWYAAATIVGTVSASVAWAGPTGCHPHGICIDSATGTAYVGCTGTNEVRVFSIGNTGTFTYVKTISGVVNPTRLRFDGRYLWAVSSGTTNLYRIDPTGSGTVVTVTMPGTFSDYSDVLFDGSMIWVSNGTRVVRLDPDTMQIVLSAPGPGTPDMRGLALSRDGDLYVVMYLGPNSIVVRLVVSGEIGDAGGEIKCPVTTGDFTIPIGARTCNVNQSLTGDLLIHLPDGSSGVSQGQRYTVKDGGGSAGVSHSLKVRADTVNIDGSGSDVVFASYDSMTYEFDGHNWLKVSALGSAVTFGAVQAALGAASSAIAVNSQKITGLAAGASSSSDACNVTQAETLANNAVTTAESYASGVASTAQANAEAYTDTQIASVVPNTRQIVTSTPIGGGGALTGDLTLSLSRGPGLAVTGGALVPDFGTTTNKVAAGDDSRFAPAPSAAGKIIYDTGTAYAALAAGTAGHILQANGAAAPSWVASPAPPALVALASRPAPGPSGQTFIANDATQWYVSDGTNWNFILPGFTSAFAVPPTASSFTTASGGGPAPSLTDVPAGLLYTGASASGVVLDVATIAYNSSKVYTLVMSGVPGSNVGTYLVLRDAGGVTYAVGAFGGIYDDGRWTNLSTRAAFSAGSALSPASGFWAVKVAITGGNYVFSYTTNFSTWTAVGSSQSTISTGSFTATQVGLGILPYLATATLNAMAFDAR